MQPSLNAVNPRVNTNATVRRNQGEETMTTALTHRILTALTSTIAALVILGTPVLSQGATITWMAYSDWNWDGATANWADGGAVAFSSGDVTQFVRGTSPAGTVAIQAGGVDPASITIWGGYGAAWTFTGGDVTSGTVNMNQDNTGNFDRDASYSFAGGTFINSNGHITFRPPTATGNLQFGSSAITLNSANGSFQFLPGTSGAVLTNTFTVGANGGRLNGNGNASFTGQVNMTSASGVVSAEGRNIFNNTWSITGSGMINIPSSYDSGSWGIFNGFVDAGGTGDVTIYTGGGTGTPTDYYAALAGAGGWDVKNVTLTGGGAMTIVPNSATFWSGVGTNGGQVIVEYGKAVPTTGNHYDSTSGTYTIAVDHQVLNNARIQAALIVITDGATVSGDGTLYGSTTNVGTGATTGYLSPGSSIGTLNVGGDLVLGSNAIYMADFNANGVDSDVIAVAGDLTLGGTLDASGYVFPNVYTIFTFTGTASGAFGAVTGLSADLTKWTVAIDNINGLVTFQAVPEPTVAVILALGAVPFLRRRRR